jgi:protein-disulfide isomerase
MSSKESSAGLTPREIAAKHRESELRKERTRRAVIGGAIIAAVAAIVVIVALLFKKNTDSTTTTSSEGPAPAYGNQYGGVTMIKGGTLKKAGGVTVNADSVGSPGASTTISGTIKTKKGEPGHGIFYVDMACPHCAAFEGAYGDYIKGLVNDGKLNAEYRVISILDQPANKNYSTRAGGALMSVADKHPEKFYDAMRTMFAQQPNEQVGSDAAAIKKMLSSAGVPSDIESMVDNGDFRPYVKFTNALAAHDSVQGTPSVYIEGVKWDANNDFKKFVEDTLAARS